MNLSVKENDAEINIKQEFNKIFSDPATYPVFENNNDMPRFKYYDIEGNRNPCYDSNAPRSNVKLTANLINRLRATGDPRIFKYAEPAWPSGSSLWSEADQNDFRNDVNNYVGLDPSQPRASELTKTVSNLHLRYSSERVGEDYSRLTYADLNFIIAEAAVRGWITADAGTYFCQGIEASMLFYGIAQEVIDEFLAAPVNVFVGTGDKNKAIEQINMEKWVAYFMNSHWEMYYNIRRLKVEGIGPNNDGVPQLVTGDDFRLSQLPMRWMYPENEYFTNADNVKKAVQSQFGKEGETVSDMMWMLKQ
jgi:hypothetical protein